jgi:excisionase family DNA binding protein
VDAEPAVLTPSDVAKRWNCSPGHIRRLCRSGQLPAMRLGSDWRIGADAVAAYWQAHMNRPEPEPSPVSEPEPVAPAPSVAVGGLPEGYSPVFPHLWNQ